MANVDQDSDEDIKSPVTTIILVVAAILTVFVVCAAGAFLAAYHTNSEYISGIGSLLGGVVTGIAFLWLLVNTWMQTNELSLQRKELMMQRRVLEKTATSTFYQFFLMFSKSHEESLNRICVGLIDYLKIEVDEKNHSPVEALASYNGIVNILTSQLENDSIGLLRSDMELYVNTFKTHEHLLGFQEVDGTASTLLFTLYAENPAAQLNGIFLELLKSS